MKLTLHVDTNDYNEDNEEQGDNNYTPEWSLSDLQRKTFHEWRAVGQTGFWTVDGETFCGTRYECETNLTDETLLRCLVQEIKKLCGDRFLNMWFNEILIEWEKEEMFPYRHTDSPNPDIALS